MFLVVAFGSSLDVAAVEMELGLPLDYNKYVHTSDLSSVSCDPCHRLACSVRCVTRRFDYYFRMSCIRELQTVGKSNLLSGLCGGFTGSYIFTQTIFGMRRGVTTRAAGITIVLVEVLVILIPVSVTSYLPKLVFGSLLVLIAVDLVVEWLVSRRLRRWGGEGVLVWWAW